MSLNSPGGPAPGIPGGPAPGNPGGPAPGNPGGPVVPGNPGVQHPETRVHTTHARTGQDIKYHRYNTVLRLVFPLPNNIIPSISSSILCTYDTSDDLNMALSSPEPSLRSLVKQGTSQRTDFPLRPSSMGE